MQMEKNPVMDLDEDASKATGKDPFAVTDDLESNEIQWSGSFD